MDMEKLLSGDFPFYRFRNLSAYPELMHFVSSGVKNIGFSDRENPEIIQHNRRSLAEAAGFEVERLITARQVHSATVRIVTAEEAGRGALDRESRIPAGIFFSFIKRNKLCMVPFVPDLTSIGRISEFI